MVRTASSTLDPAHGQVAHLIVVASPLIAFWKIVGLVVTPTSARRRALQVARCQAFAAEVVEPDGDPGGGEIGEVVDRT